MTLSQKVEKLNALRPLSADAVASLSAAWDTNMIYESNSIEGNSLTLRETDLVLAKGLTVSGKLLKDHIEAVNLAEAWEHVKTLAQNAGTDLRSVKQVTHPNAETASNTNEDFSQLSSTDLMLAELGFFPTEFIDDTQSGFVDRRVELLAYAKARNTVSTSNPSAASLALGAPKIRPCLGLTEADLLTIHRIVLTRVQDHHAGSYRTGTVGLSGSSLNPPNALKVPELMEQLFADIAKISEPVQQAAALHHGITRIHPFADGNGRSARLAMNFILLAAQYPPVSISPDIRLAYYQALEAADQDNLPVFQSFIEQQLHRELDTWLAALSTH